MAERDLIESTPEPITRSRLAEDLVRLGVRQDGVLLVHASLSKIGWVIGGARTVIEVLLDAIGPGGSLVMPAFSGDLSDPAVWVDPPVPEAWHAAIRAEMAAFDPARTPTRDMGQIAEQFRTWPGVRRSHHPSQSLAAFGPHAARITQRHSLDFGLGHAGPMGALYALAADVLLIGVGHDRNSSLHLAEARAPNGRRQVCRLPVQGAEGVVWERHPDVADDNGRLFPRIGAAFEATGAVRSGLVGQADTRLMPQAALVDFATAWLQREFAQDAPATESENAGC